MARTAPVPDIPPIPGMNPGTVVAGGGGVGGGDGGGDGSAGDGNAHAKGDDGGDDAGGDGRNALGCGPGSASNGGACPNHHGGSSSGSAAHGDPIDIVTGRVFTHPAVDLRLPGPLPLVFARSYSSHARDRDVGLGYGWSHSFAWEILLEAHGLTLLTDAGDAVDFGSLVSGQANLGPNGWIVHAEGESLALEMPDGSLRRFEHVQAGQRRRRLRAVEDRSGNRLTLGYGALGLHEIIDATGRFVRLVRDRAGRIIEIRVTADQSAFVMTRYAYDERGQLASATDADGNMARYGYDDGGQHLLSWHELPTRFRYHFRYDRRGRGVETWGAFRDGPDPGLSTRAGDVLSDKHRRAKGSQHVVVDYFANGYREVVDARTSHRGEANRFGKLDKAVVAASVHTRRFDEIGRLRSFTDPLGATTEWERDVFGNETRIVDALGNVTEIERLPKGDVVRVRDEMGGVTEVTYERGSVSWVDPMGARCEIQFDARGLLARAIGPDGTPLDYGRDPAGNPIGLRVFGAMREESAYDVLGRRIAMRNAAGRETTLLRSPKGLLLEAREANGARWRYGYDGADQIVEVRDPLDRVTRIVRAGSGLAADVHRPDGSVVRLRYDRMDALVDVLCPGGQVYAFERNALGLPIAETTFDGGVVRHRYDAAGRLVATRWPNGDLIEITRDLRGRIFSRVYNDEETETFVHDARGDVIAAERGVCRVDIVRNAVGWIVAEAQIVDGEAVRVDVEYDLVGRVVRRRTSLGHELERSREPETRTTHTRLDRADSVVAEHDAAGREVRRMLPGGAVVHTSYDAGWRVLRRSVASPYAPSRVGPGEPQWVGPANFGLTSATEYAYTLAGELASRRDAEHGVLRYEYDALGQLTRVASERETGDTDPSHAFSYTAFGEMHEGTGAQSRRYDRGGRLALRGGTKYRWDERGRLVEREDGDGAVTQYEWLASGLLGRVVLPDRTVVAFLYDAFARRMKKTVLRIGADGTPAMASETRFVWDGSTLVHTITTSSGKRRLRTYVFDDAEAPWAHKDEGGAWVFYITGPVGAPERLVDGEGRVLADVSLSPWGEAPEGVGQQATPIRFVGHYADEETGLHYSGYRYYDPRAGRFVSPDPLGLVGGLDPYAYAQNQPTGFVDLDGLVYSRIVDPKTGAVLYEGYSTDEARGRDAAHGGAIDPTPLSQKPCAEAQALKRMHNAIAEQIRQEQKGVRMQDRLTSDQINEEASRRIGGRFENEGLQMETFQTKGGPRVDPCPVCGQMIQGLGIQAHIVGAKGTVGKFGTYRRPRGQ